jgi:thiamine-monophosphate kinase
MNEDVFLGNLFQTLPGPPAEVVIPPGDDCAGVLIGPERLLLLAVDQIVGDRHYLLSQTPPTEPWLVGRKLANRNLSDIAAMGGTPLYCLVAAGMCDQTPPEWMNGFFGGIVDACARHRTHMIGGDLASCPHDAVSSLSIVGEVHPDRVLRRGTARCGDLVFVTGHLGQSFPSRHHLLFEPRVEQGQWLAGQRLATAAIDISDGFLLDAARICRASSLSMRIRTEVLPRRTGSTTVQQALCDGEDYELLFTVAPESADRLVSEWPFPDLPLTSVGVCTEGGDGRARILDESGEDLLAGQEGGYDHFRRNP